MPYTYVAVATPDQGDTRYRVRMRHRETQQVYDWVNTVWVARPGTFADVTLALEEVEHGFYEATLPPTFTQTANVLFEVFDTLTTPDEPIFVENVDLINGSDVGLSVDAVTESVRAAITEDHGEGSYSTFGISAPKSNYLAPEDKRFVLTSRSDGDVNAEQEIILIVGEQVSIGFDFSRTAGAQHIIHSATVSIFSESVAGGLVVEVDGENETNDGTNSHNHANIRAVAVSAGEYVVQCQVLTDTGMTLRGRGRVTVEA